MKIADLNPGHPVSEATALSGMPQPLSIKVFENKNIKRAVIRVD